jgi:hypothetical protein
MTSHYSRPSNAQSVMTDDDSSLAPPTELKITTSQQQEAPLGQTLPSLFLRHLLIAFIGSLAVNVSLLVFTNGNLDRVRIGTGMTASVVVAASAKAALGKHKRSDMAGAGAFIAGVITGVI